MLAESNPSFLRKGKGVCGIITRLIRRRIFRILIDLPDRPAGSLSEDLVFTLTPGLELWQKSGIATVSHGDRDIAMEPLPSCALKR
jgi:hypothetical protein